MGNRRVLFDIPLRSEDIPKIPAIVNDLQSMLHEHTEIDPVQHRLVHWRGLGEYSANLWLSCYTKPSQEGIRLKSYVAVQQSILERAAAIVYKHGADFASSNDRLLRKSAPHVESTESS